MIQLGEIGYTFNKSDMPKKGHPVLSLISLIYMSSATRQMSQEDLLEILNKAREKNGTLNITGMLLYKHGKFLQILEGEKQDVEALYDIIKQDPRHYQILTSGNRPIQEREFGDWKMGFVNLDDFKPEEIEGFSDYLNRPIDEELFKNDASLAHRFLRAFRTVATKS